MSKRVLVELILTAALLISTFLVWYSPPLGAILSLVVGAATLWVAYFNKPPLR